MTTLDTLERYERDLLEANGFPPNERFFLDLRIAAIIIWALGDKVKPHWSWYDLALWIRDISKNPSRYESEWSRWEDLFAGRTSAYQKAIHFLIIVGGASETYGSTLDVAGVQHYSELQGIDPDGWDPEKTWSEVEDEFEDSQIDLRLVWLIRAALYRNTVDEMHALLAPLLVQMGLLRRNDAERISISLGATSEEAEGPRAEPPAPASPPESDSKLTAKPKATVGKVFGVTALSLFTYAIFRGAQQ